MKDLKTKVSLNNSNFRKGMAQVEKSTQDAKKEIDKIKDSAKKVGDSFGKMMSPIKTATSSFVKVGAVGATALGALATECIATVGGFKGVADATGLTTQTVQSLNGAFSVCGVSMEDAKGDFAALSEKMYDASNGAGDLGAIADYLGISIYGANGQVKSLNDFLPELITGLQGVEDETLRASIATNLLSTTGEELAPILAMNSEEFKKLQEATTTSLSDEDLQRFSELKMTFGILIQAIKATATELLAGFLPSMQQALDKCLEFVSVLKNEGIGGALDYLREQFNLLKEELEGTFLGSLLEIGEQFFNISSTLSQSLIPVLSEFLKSITPLVEALADWISRNPELTQQIIGVMVATKALSPVLSLAKFGFDGVKGATSLLKSGLGLLKGTTTATSGAIGGLTGASTVASGATSTLTKSTGLLSKAKSGLSGIVGKASGSISGLFTKAVGGATKSLTSKGLISGVLSLGKTLLTKCNPYVAGASVAVGVAGTAYSWWKGRAKDTEESVSTSMSNVASETTSATNEVGASVDGMSAESMRSIQLMGTEMYKGVSTSFYKMSEKARQECSNLYNGCNGSMSKMASMGRSHATNLYNGVTTSVRRMAQVCISEWNRIRSAYSRPITGRINISKVTTTSTRSASSRSMVRTQDNSVNINISSFTNNTKEDVNKLMERIAFETQRRKVVTGSW